MSEIKNTNLINEEEYQKINKKLRLISKILLIVGAVAFIVSLIGFIIARNIFNKQVQDWYNNSVNNPYSVFNTNMPADHSGIFLIFLWISLGILMFGGFIFAISYHRQIIAYKINTVAPIASEVNEKYTRPFVIRSGSTFGKMYKNFKEEVKDTKDEEEYCPHCGASIKKDAIYCSKCGTKLKDEE